MRLSVGTVPCAGSHAATVSYSYYPDGELKTISDGSSSITNSFDRLNRLVAVASSVPPVTSVVTHQHDAVGNVTNTTVSSAGSAALCETAYSFDAAERLTETSRRGTEEQRFVYSYSPINGLVSSVSNTASGIVCSYEHDLMDRVTNIVYTAGTNQIRSLAYEYNDVGMITKKITEIGNQTTEVSYLYDSLDRLVCESVRSSTSSVPSVVNYRYDLAGNRTAKILNNSTIINYQLGTGNRLAATASAATNLLFVSGSASELIGTDPRWGELWITNLTTGTSGELSVNGKSFFAGLPATAGQTNSVKVAIRDRAGNMGYALEDYYCGTNGATTSSSFHQYNAAGCLTNLNGVSLEWDERYRLTNFYHAEAQSTQSVAYAYDVQGRRMSCGVGSQSQTNTTYFIYDGNQVVADLDGEENVIRSYVWGQGIDNLLSFTDHTTSNTYYAIKDHQNTVIALVDGTGSVVESYEYSAYGEILDVKDGAGNSIGNQQSTIGNRYTFQGREIDWTTGLYHFRARWYDPGTGRWLLNVVVAGRRLAPLV